LKWVKQNCKSGANEHANQQLCFKVATDQPFDDHQRWIERTIPGAHSHLVLFTPPGNEDRIGGFSNVTFYSNDIQGTYEELSATGRLSMSAKKHRKSHPSCAILYVLDRTSELEDFPVPVDYLQQIIEEIARPKLLEASRQAFAKGVNF
jgi:hypothetical protein